MNAETFLQNFGHLADAPAGVKKLRELVLNLAVQGKLVSQCDKDEPAEVIIQKIAARKKEAIQEGTIRRSATLPQLSDEELPWKIPAAWKWVRFGEVTINRDGERVPLSKAVRESRRGPYDYYGASGVIDHIDDFIFDKPLLLIGEDGANLINRSTPIAFIAEGQYWVNNHAHVLDSISLDCLRYIEVFINAVDLKPYVTGTAQPKMNQAKMNSIPVAFPPEREQVRIVAKVDELMTLCDELEARQQERRTLHVHLNSAALDRLTSAANDTKFTAAWTRVRSNFDLLYSVPENVTALRQAILQLAVQGKLVEQDPSDGTAGLLLEQIRNERSALVKANLMRKPRIQPPVRDDDIPFNVPRTWTWARLDDITKGISDGVHRKPTYTNEGVPFVMVRNLTVGPGISFDDVKYVSHEDHAEFIKRTHPEKGDILITKDGTIGVVRVIETDVEFSLFVSVALVKPVKPAMNEFLALALSAPGVQQQIVPKGAALKHLHLVDLRKLLVPVPPLAEQLRIAARARAFMDVCDELETKLTRQQSDADRLTEAMVSAILDGEA